MLRKKYVFWKKIVGGYQMIPQTNFRHTFRKFLPDPPPVEMENFKQDKSDFIRYFKHKLIILKNVIIWRRKVENSTTVAYAHLTTLRAQIDRRGDIPPPL